jgi:hypothetical protein
LTIVDVDHFGDCDWARVPQAFSADEAAAMRQATWRALGAAGIDEARPQDVAHRGALAPPGIEARSVLRGRRRRADERRARFFDVTEEVAGCRCRSSSSPRRPAT